MSARRRPACFLVLPVLWFLLGIVAVASEVEDLRLVLGMTGRPGELTVTECVDEGRGRTACTGTFVPADGGRPVAGVATVPEARPGTTVPAQVSDDLRYAHPTGTAALLGTLALPGLGLAALAAPGWFLVRRRGPAARAAVLVVVAAGLGLCVAGIIAANG